MRLIQALLTALLLQSTHAQASEEHGAEHSFHPNVMAVFLGVTSATRREGSFTLGLEYNRRFSENFGVGVLAERVFADHEFNIFAVGFAWNLDRFKLYVAPGVEKSQEHDAEFLLRLGAEYAFEIGNGIEISPQVDIDFVDGEQVFVFGLSFGKGF